jgi:hypothetical protein
MVMNPRALHVVGEVCARGVNRELMRCRQQFDNLVAQSRLISLIGAWKPCGASALLLSSPEEGPMLRQHVCHSPVSWALHKGRRQTPL